MRREIFLENGYIFCVFLLYPLKDIFKKVAPFVCSRALPIEEGCAKCKFHSYTDERKFEKWFTKSDFLALPYERLFF